MKRIICIMLAVMLLCGTAVNVMASPAMPIADDNAALLKALNIIAGDDVIRLEKNINRCTFAGYAAKMIKATDIVSGEIPFWDVDKNTPWCSAILTLYSIGAITGNEDRGFAPLDDITLGAAVKILNKLLGYSEYASMNGGYPFGELTVAKQSGLLGGINASAESALTYADAVKLLVNALNVTLLEKASYNANRTKFSTDSNETILSRYYDIYFSEGVVESTPVASLSYNGKVLNDSIIINDVVYETSYDVAGLLGYNVNCYYRTDKNTKGKSVVFIVKNQLNSELTLNCSDIIDYDNGVISFYDDRGKRTKENISDESSIVFNGRPINYLTDYTNELFEIKNGTVTLLDNDDNGKYDVAHIKSYTTVIVQRVDPDNKLIYDKYDKTKQLDLSDDGITYSIKDVFGEELIINNLAEGDVLSVLKSLDNKNIDIVVAYQQVEGTLNGFVKNPGDEKIIVGENEYSIASDAVFAIDNNAKPGVKVLSTGKQYTVYFDSFGKVVDCIASTVAGIKFGYLLMARTEDSVSEEVIFDFYDSTGHLNSLPLEKNALIDGKKLTLEEKKAKFVPDESSAYLHIPFNYSINSAGKLINIDTPELGNETKDTLSQVYSGNRRYKNNGTLYGSYIADAGIPVFALPMDRDNYEDIVVVTASDLGNDVSYPMDLYVMEENSPKLCMIVVRDGRYSGSISTSTPLAIVTAISKSVDKDGNEVKKADIYQSGSNMSAIISDTVSEEFDKVGVGDLIRFSLDRSGQMSMFEWYYDYDKKQALDKLETPEIFNSEYRMLFGRVVATYDSWFRIIGGTDVSKAYLDDGKTINIDNVEVHKITTAIRYEVVRGKVIIDKILPNEIVDYETGGEDASTLVVTTRFSYFLSAFVIK